MVSLLKANQKARLFKEFIMPDKNGIPTVDEIHKALMPKKDDPRIKVIKAGDMSPETKALPDETRKTPKGIGSSEKDMGPIEYKKKGGMVKSSASKRADGIAVKGKTRGKIC
jgi:hypothetical protein